MWPSLQLIDWHDFVLVETLNFNEDGSDCAMPLPSKDLLEKIKCATCACACT